MVGGEGVQNGPKLRDVIYGRPLIIFFETKTPLHWMVAHLLLFQEDREMIGHYLDQRSTHRDHCIGLPTKFTSNLC